MTKEEKRINGTKYHKDIKDNTWFAIRMSVTPKQRQVLFHYLVKRKSKTEIGNTLKTSDAAVNGLIVGAAIRVARHGRHWKCCEFNKNTTVAEIKTLFLHLHKTGVCNIDKNRETDRMARKRQKEKNRIWAKISAQRYRQQHGCSYRTTRYQRDSKFRLNHRISRGIAYSLKAGKGGVSWTCLVYYTIDELIRHLERLFQTGMTWENYGKGGWEIDHIIPQSVFNFTKPEDEDFKRCWMLSNLQPMWGSENSSKGAKLEKHFQPSLIFGEKEA
ncbi:MAG TPA: hypothetical protein ENI07_00700 [Desulfobacterales bacterium]|nr:hypothetical protein [Desulfobacterales bacterium]